METGPIFHRLAATGAQWRAVPARAVSKGKKQPLI